MLINCKAWWMRFPQKIKTDPSNFTDIEIAFYSTSYLGRVLMKLDHYFCKEKNDLLKLPTFNHNLLIILHWFLYLAIYIYTHRRLNSDLELVAQYLIRQLLQIQKWNEVWVSWLSLINCWNLERGLQISPNHNWIHFKQTFKNKYIQNALDSNFSWTSYLRRALLANYFSLISFWVCSYVLWSWWYLEQTLLKVRVRWY